MERQPTLANCAKIRSAVDTYAVTSLFQKISNKDYGCLGIIFLVGLIASLPMLAGCGLYAYDFMFHFVASQNFSDELWSGNPYPRWLASMNGGFGSPIFFFYGPVAYFLTSLFHPFAGSGSQACVPLGLGSLLALGASGWTAYLWLRSSSSPGAALAGAGFYMLLPYHLSTNLYLRFAYAEFWAFVWMPLALYFARALALGSPRAQLGLACSLALLAGTHLPVFLIFSIVPIGYCLLLTPSQRRTTTLLGLAGAYLLMIGLSAVYWLPALTTQNWVSMEEMRTSKLLYSNNFLSLPVLNSPGALKQLFAIQEFISLLIISLAIAIVMRLGRKRLQIEALYLGLIGYASVAMMLPASAFIWKALPMLQQIQFPGRFNAVLAVSLAGVTALAATAISTSLRTPYAQAWHQRWRGLVFLLSASLLLLIQKALLGNPSWQGEGVAWIRIARYMAASGFLIALLPIPPKFLAKRPWLQLLITAFWLISLYLISDQHYPQIFSRRINPSSSPFAISQLAASEHFPKGIEAAYRNPRALLQWSRQTPQAKLLGPGGSTEVRRWRSRSIGVQVEVPKPDVLELHQFHYPGWTAHRDPGGEPLPIERSAQGLLQVKLPAGRYTVNVDLNAIAPEKIGWLISSISSVGLVLFWIRTRPRKVPHTS